MESPLSSLQESAVALHELFLTLTKAGFSEDQSLKIVSRVILNPSEDTRKPGDA